MNGSTNFITVFQEITIIHQVVKLFSEIIDIDQLCLSKNEMIISLLLNPKKAVGVQPASESWTVIIKFSTEWGNEPKITHNEAKLYRHCRIRKR